MESLADNCTHPSDHSGRSLDTRAARVALSDPTGRGQGGSPRTDGWAGSRESPLARFLLGSRAGGLRPEEAAQLAPWAAKMPSKGSVCFPPRVPRLVTTCAVVAWGTLAIFTQALDDELWKHSGKVGLGSDNPSRLWRRGELGRTRGGSTFTHAALSVVERVAGEGCAQREGHQVIHSSFLPTCSLSVRGIKHSRLLVLGGMGLATQ